MTTETPRSVIEMASIWAYTDSTGYEGSQYTSGLQRLLRAHGIEYIERFHSPRRRQSMTVAESRATQWEKSA